MSDKKDWVEKLAEHVDTAASPVADDGSAVPAPKTELSRDVAREAFERILASREERSRSAQ